MIAIHRISLTAMAVSYLVAVFAIHRQRPEQSRHLSGEL